MSYHLSNIFIAHFYVSVRRRKIVMIAKGFTEPTARIKALKAEVVNAVPEVEPYRAVLITESYKETEGMPAVMRRAKANEKIFNNLPVVIRDNELIVGALSVKPRSTNLCPEFSFDWVEKESSFDDTNLVLWRYTRVNRVLTNYFFEFFI